MERDYTEELHTILIANGISADTFSNKVYKENTICMIKNLKGWNVYYCKTGKKHELKIHETQREAYRDVIARLSNNDSELETKMNIEFSRCYK